jgi:soluble lytic murein transglycosylase-like protein
MARYRVANPGPNAYFGLMQVKLMAAREVLGRWPKLFEQFGFHTRTDDEVKANLILNERFNIEIATRYLKILQGEYGLRGQALMTAYNKGPTGARDGVASGYADGAQAKLVSYHLARR